MKIILLTFILSIAHFVLLAQNGSSKGIGESLVFSYTFEPEDVYEENDNLFKMNAYHLLEFDTTGIWQIGKPNKMDWDSAYAGEFALVTDTVKMLDKPAKASFTFKFDRPWYSNCMAGWNVQTPHLYDLPRAKPVFTLNRATIMELPRYMLPPTPYLATL